MMKLAVLASEAIGTFLLTLTVGMNVVGGSGPFAVLSIGITLAVLVYALHQVSACFNPAVSVALALCKKMAWADVGPIVVAQLGGAIAAGFTYKFLHGEAFALAPAAGWPAAAAVEVIFTALLCLAVLATCTTKATEGNQYFGLAVGFSVLAGGYAAGPLSGGVLNPAIAVGVDVSAAHSGWCIAYSGWQFVGSALSALLFYAAFPAERGSAGSGAEKYIGEATGTFYLTLTAFLNIVHGAPAPALSIAAALCVCIWIFGSVSGGHFNPAVTLAALSDRYLKHEAGSAEVLQALGYGLCQAGGAIAAAFLGTALSERHSFPVAPGTAFSVADACIAEAVFTAVLCFLVLRGAAGGWEDFHGLSIGLCVVVGGFAAGSVSGGVLNPAVTAGIDISDTVLKHANYSGTAAAYAGAQLLGGCGAVLAHRVVSATGVGKGQRVV